MMLPLAVGMKLYQTLLEFCERPPKAQDWRGSEAAVVAPMVLRVVENGNDWIAVAVRQLSLEGRGPKFKLNVALCGAPNAVTSKSTACPVDIERNICDCTLPLAS